MPANGRDAARLHGDGIADDKHGIAVILHALTMLKPLSVDGADPLRCVMPAGHSVAAERPRPFEDIPIQIEPHDVRCIRSSSHRAIGGWGSRGPARPSEADD